jgi:nitroimidazol reductase NimA-like FMN-containing flavoprotein (pyridoxamine 5'-phosphate oxidase superfamily)
MSDIANDDRPTFRPLSRQECESLLERNHVGRIAFTFHDRVDIQPIHYVFANGVLVGRTSEGAKLVTLEHNRWLAFEADEVRGMFDWQSVVVHGTFVRLDPEGTAAQRLAAEDAVIQLRALLPETNTEADPVAFRSALFQIVIREMTGRAAESG